VVKLFAVIGRMIIFYARTETENRKEKKYEPVFPESLNAGKVEVL
jgi:hypothetical protein